MDSISLAEVQELVSQLPEEKLPQAYRLLRNLAEQQRETSPQVEFVRLPIDERRRLLTQQANEMVGYYELTMDNPEDQDELNRQLRKPGEPDPCPSAKIGRPAQDEPKPASHEDNQGTS